MSAPPAASDETSSGLLSRARNRDPAAWLRLVEWIGVLILRWCRRARLQAADCDEVAQQVLINVWRGLGAFRRDRPGDSFRGWVYTITRNCIHDLRARRQRDPFPLLTDLPAEPDPSERDELRQRALRLLLQDVLACNANDLGFRAFYRTAVDGLSGAEVARELGMSAELVRQHKCRWTKRLRDQLREQFGGLLG
jgi:RNA polymerase sigma-70 factor (ECF subfamily)